MKKSVYVLVLFSIMSALLCSCSKNATVNVNWDLITEKEFEDVTSRLRDSYIDGYEEGSSDVPIYPFVGYTTYAMQPGDKGAYHTQERASCSYGFINENGVIVSDPVYDWFYDFGDWYLVASGPTEKCRSFFVVSKDGQEVTQYGDEDLSWGGELNNYIYLKGSNRSAVVLDLNGDFVAESHFEKDSKYSNYEYIYYGKYLVNEKYLRSEKGCEVYDLTTGKSHYISADKFQAGFGDTICFVKNDSLHFFTPEEGILFPESFYKECKAIPNGDGYYVLKKTHGGYDIRNISNELICSIDHDYCEAYDDFFVAYDDSEIQKMYTYSLSGELLASKTFDADVRSISGEWGLHPYQCKVVSIRCPDTDKYRYILYDKNLNVIYKSKQVRYSVVRDRVNNDLYVVTPEEIKNLNTGKTQKFSKEFSHAVVDSISDGKIFICTLINYNRYYYLIDMKNNVYFAYNAVIDFDFVEDWTVAHDDSKRYYI